MNREVHVRVREGLRGKFPRPTRHTFLGAFRIPVIVFSYQWFGIICGLWKLSRVKSNFLSAAVRTKYETHHFSVITMFKDSGLSC